jgi:hypothetical protein
VAWGSNYSGETNVPVGLSNVVQIAAGGGQGLALLRNSSFTAWGSPTNWPVGLSNIVSLASGNNHSLALTPNLAPQAQSQVVTGFPNHDVVITLVGSDVNKDPLTFQINALPANGGLFQYNAGSRGPAILSSAQAVSDPNGRIIFAPAANEIGSPHAIFSFVTHDGEAYSAPATVSVNVVLPPGPQISPVKSRVQVNGTFDLNFSGQSNATYRVWASTNLVNWESLGNGLITSNGWFQFLDSSASNWPQRFYRAGAP